MELGDGDSSDIQKTWNNPGELRNKTDGTTDPWKDWNRLEHSTVEMGYWVEFWTTEKTSYPWDCSKGHHLI